MNRRALLTTISTITAGVAGCLGTSSTGNNDGNSDGEWQHNLVANHLTVSHGQVYGNEAVSEDSDDANVNGGIFALDGETGDRQWSYGSSDGSPALSYSLTENGIYLSQDDDQPKTPGSITALDFDGTIRWENISGWFADAVADTAYINVPGSSHQEGSSDPHLRALNADTGEQLWTSTYGGAVEFDSESNSPLETAYVNRDTLAAVDANDGSVKWSYGNAEDSFMNPTVANGVVYSEVNWDEALVAVSEGEKLWTVDSIHPHLVGISSDHVLAANLGAESQFPIYAFDRKTGKKRWVQKDIKPGEYGTSIIFNKNRLYIGERGQISAISAEDGSKLWSTPLESEARVKTLDVVPENGSDQMVFVLVEQARTEYSLHQISANGEEIWMQSFDEQIRDFAVGESIIVATDSGISALDPL